MRKKMVLGLGLLSMVLFVAMMCNPASAATYAVGVKVNDTADYDVSTTLSGKTDATKMHVLVYGVVGTTVTLNLTYTFENGSQSKPEQLSGDVAGSNNVWYYLIAKNLTTNDPISPSSILKINGTETMTAAGASRTVCHLNSTFIFDSGNVWWDRETGILVKSNLLILVSLWPLHFAWINATLTSTSIWSGGLFGLSTTTLIIIAVVGVVVIAAIVLLARRGKK